jgi:hypothetical protein
MNTVFSNGEVELINRNQFTAEKFDEVTRGIRKWYSGELKDSRYTLLVSSSAAFNI